MWWLRTTGVNQQAGIHQITGLGRPIDLRHRSNLIALLGSATFGALLFTTTWAFDGAPDLGATISGAIGAFLAWAIARELDPGRPQVATVALAVAGLSAVFAPPAALMAGLLILAVRIMVGSVGADLRRGDWVVLVAAAGYAGTEAVGWPIAVAMIFAAARRSETPAWLLPTMSLASVVSAMAFADMPAPGMPATSVAIVIVAAIVLGLVNVRPPRISTLSDSGAGRISGTDVTVARLVALVAIAGGTFLAPQTALTDLAPAIAVVLAMALPRLSAVSGNSTTSRQADHIYQLTGDEDPYRSRSGPDGPMNRRPGNRLSSRHGLNS